MDVVRLGIMVEESSIPTVVSITVDWIIDPPIYMTTKATMEYIVYQAGFSDVQVEFKSGEISVGAQVAPLFQNQTITLEQAAIPYIRPGSSISGPLTDTFATIGPVLEIVDKSSKVVSAAALTTRQAVAPSECAAPKGIFQVSPEPNDDGFLDLSRDGRQQEPSCCSPRARKISQSIEFTEARIAENRGPIDPQ